MATSPRALMRGYPWLDTVSHEFVHFLVTHKGRNTVPIWLQEGLAKFLETRWRGEPGKAIDPAQEDLLVRAAKKKELIPFAAMHPSIAKLPTQEKAALAFAEVEAAMRLLYQRGGQDGAHRIGGGDGERILRRERGRAGLRKIFRAVRSRLARRDREAPAASGIDRQRQGAGPQAGLQGGREGKEGRGDCR